ncbi:MAG TPA: hypothetical protein VLG47_05195 [Candidatus Saccharimonadales bacterium]|nr:hypothetical protein [Candidatus Saccharimonadales bacterium]
MESLEEFNKIVARECDEYWLVGIGKHVQRLRGHLLTRGWQPPRKNSLVRLCVDRDANPYYNPGIRSLIAIALNRNNGYVTIEWYNSIADGKSIEFAPPPYGMAVCDVSDAIDSPISFKKVSKAMHPNELGGMLFIATRYFETDRERLHYTGYEVDLRPQVPDHDIEAFDLATETTVSFSPWGLAAEILSKEFAFSTPQIEHDPAIVAAGEIVLAKVSQRQMHTGG